MLQRLRDFKSGCVIRSKADSIQVFLDVVLIFIFIFGVALCGLAFASFLVCAYPNPSFVFFTVILLFFVGLFFYGMYLSFSIYACTGSEHRKLACKSKPTAKNY